MAYRYDLTDAQWAQIKDFLPGNPQDGKHGRHCMDNRRFLSAVMWIAKTGAQWRALPDEYGPWITSYQRFNRWSKKGIFQSIFNTLAASADTEWLMLDATIVKVNQYATGAKKGA